MRITARVAALALLLLPQGALCNDSGEWELYAEHGGIRMYRREVSGNPVLAYKGIGALEAPLGKLLTVIVDTPSKPQWMSRIQTAEVVREISPTERIEYIHLRTPWPLKDRDFVYRAKMNIDATNNKILIEYESVEEPSRPEHPDRIRAQIYKSTFTLGLGEDPKKTYLEAEAHADPKGSIPKWLVNSYQKRLPQESIQGLMKRVSQPWIVESPFIRDAIKGFFK